VWSLPLRPFFMKNAMIDITIPGRNPRQCKGEQIGEREDQRLFLLWSPYKNWKIEHVRLALVNENDVAYRIFSFHQAPKWAKTFFFARFNLSSAYLPLRK
jgi:hypothetical protein